MGLLDKLKSLFGSDQDGRSSTRDTEPGVTVEHEPAAESEHAVKGTDRAQQQMNDEQESGESTAESVSESEQAATDESESTVASTTEHTQPGPVTDEPAEDEPAADEGTVESPTEEQATLDEEPATDESTDSPSVEEIKGIGPTYAERLESIGVETVADLAAADPAEVAAAAQTGESRAGDWVERAQDF